MNRLLLKLLLGLMILLIGCPGAREPEGIVRQMLEPQMELDHPVYYWETHNGETAVYRIQRNTNDINILLHGLDGVRDVNSSLNATYILHDDRNGFLSVTRLEKDSRRTTEARPEVNLTATGQALWDVSDNDVVVLTGIDSDETHHVVALTFTRTEPEETFRQDVVNEPEIGYLEIEWYSGPSEIAALSISEDGDHLAIALSEAGDEGDQGLYFVDSPGSNAQRAGEYPVIELGGFSPDGQKFLATFELERRVDLYMIDVETLELEAMTRVTQGYRAGHPAWHPDGRHFLYTANFTSDFTMGDTPLSGEQLYMYGMDTRNTRRLTSFEDSTVWVDFASNGDFFLYASTHGVIGGRGRALPPRDPDAAQAMSELVTWRLYCVPWDTETFRASSTGILGQGDMRFFVSWTIDEMGGIGFTWGPPIE